MDVQVTWLRAYVEKCLRQAWEDRPVCMDEDGDFFFRCNTAACWVRVEEDASLVRVFAHAATGVKRSARLLAELNELNQRARAAKVYWESAAPSAPSRWTSVCWRRRCSTGARRSRPTSRRRSPADQTRSAGTTRTENGTVASNASPPRT